MAPGASRSAARTTLIKVLNYHWVLLGPANIFKVSYVNKPSPAAKYVVVPPAESCQADCKIARMWACLFWGLQTIVAAAIVQKKISDDAAATAKLYVGTALVVAFASDVVREPVACAGGIELVCGVLLLLRARRNASGRRRAVDSSGREPSRRINECVLLTPCSTTPTSRSPRHPDRPTH